MSWPVFRSFILALVLVALPAFDHSLPGLNASILKVYDGDTYTLIFQESSIRKAWVEERVRLYDIENDRGVDTPEIRGPEKLEGLKSKMFAQEQFAASGIEVVDTKGERDHYGRLLADVLYQCHPVRRPKELCSIAQELVGHGLAEIKDFD